MSSDAGLGQAPAPSGAAAQAVTPAAPAQPGGRGRGAVEAPAANDPLNANADLSPKPPVLPLRPEEQVKRFWLPPGYRLELIEATNVTDTPKFGNPTSSITSGDFMRIFGLNSAFAERQIRLGLRYSF